MIDGVILSPRLRLTDERGAVLRMLSRDDPLFSGFGEVYFSTVLPARVKAWRRHRETTMNLTVPAGRIRVVLFDDRAGSATAGVVDEVVLSPYDHRLLTIPPMIWFGFQGIAQTESVLCNCATAPHDPAEADRRPPDDSCIPFQWPDAVS